MCLIDDVAYIGVQQVTGHNFRWRFYKIISIVVYLNNLNTE